MIGSLTSFRPIDNILQMDYIRSSQMMMMITIFPHYKMLQYRCTASVQRVDAVDKTRRL